LAEPFDAAFASAAPPSASAARAATVVMVLRIDWA
jgi:hypothetical protein